jgi:hypothetical protein
MGNWVPWSITGFDNTSLRNLLSSTSFFKRVSNNTYEFDLDTYAPIVPALPRFTFEFMYKEGLIGNSQLGTILLVMDWIRQNLGHASGDKSFGSNENIWGYWGFPTARSIIEGDFPQYSERRPSSGCGCTTGFLQAVLRSVNIPVAYVQRCLHSMPHFLNEDLYLSHGDDLTGDIARIEEIQSIDLLISADTFHEWFDSPAADCDNVGRGAEEALANLNS